MRFVRAQQVSEYQPSVVPGPVTPFGGRDRYKGFGNPVSATRRVDQIPFDETAWLFVDTQGLATNALHRLVRVR